jgi:hypothetical protein
VDARICAQCWQEAVFCDWHCASREHRPGDGISSCTTQMCDCTSRTGALASVPEIVPVLAKNSVLCCGWHCTAMEHRQGDGITLCSTQMRAQVCHIELTRVTRPAQRTRTSSQPDVTSLVATVPNQACVLTVNTLSCACAEMMMMIPQGYFPPYEVV